MTWSIWLAPAPADDMMVVSDIGEMWSPHTAPDRQADMPMKNRGFVGSNIDATIGIRIPKVPQLVPVAKARAMATTKITAGKKLFKLPATFVMIFPTKAAEPRRSLEIFLRLVARLKIRMAEVIDEKPSGRSSIDLSKLILPLTFKNAIEIIRAMTDPVARATWESVLAKAFTKSM